MTDRDVRVLVVAASPVVRAGLRTLLDGFVVVGESSGPDGVARELDVPGEVDVIVASADVFDGADVAGLTGWPPVVLLGTDEATLALARSLDTAGFALAPPDVDARELEAAVLAAASGFVALPRGPMTRHLMTSGLTDAALPALESVERASPDWPDEALTAREHDVLRLLVTGLPNKAIGARLGVSENTVKFHLGALYSKLGVGSRAAAVREGLRRGLIVV